MSTSEFIFYWGLFALCLVASPLIVQHVQGTTDVVDSATAGMTSTSRTHARLAGTMHLTWTGLLLLSIGVLAREFEIPTLWGPAGTVAFGCLFIDALVLVVGRPSSAILHRYREAARDRQSDRSG